MGWDSNPRDPCGSAGFQDRCLQPLDHPSGEGDQILNLSDLRKLTAVVVRNSLLTGNLRGRMRARDASQLPIRLVAQGDRAVRDFLCLPGSAK